MEAIGGQAPSEVGSQGGGGGEAVKVIVRARPEEQSSYADGKKLDGSCVRCVDDHTLTISDPGRSSSERGETRERGHQQDQQAHDFTFDRVFGPESQQDEVFDMVKPLVHATVDGFTTTVFAYGSTGSGKTHTISGTDENPGVLPRAVNLLFQRLETDAAGGSDKAFMVFLTYVEIYNNVFHNLLDDSNSGGSSSSSRRHHASSAIPPPASQRLSRQATPPTPPPSTKIEVREHPSRGVFLSGGKGLRVPVRSAAEVMLLVSRGTKARRTTATGLNERSSRSHAILILEIEATAQSPSLSTGTAVKSENAARRGECSGKTRVTGLGRREETAEGAEIATKRRGGRRASIVDCVSIGKMQVIDLAGSERVSMSGVEGSSLVEAQNINLSLTLLGDVLNALSKYHRAAARACATRNRSGGGATGETGGRGTGEAGDRPFVPYRNSKLTYLLKDSMGGNCKTLMVCAVRAAPACFQQTMMSLRYAGRARDIKNIPHRVLDAGGEGGVLAGVDGQGGPSLRGTVDEIERLRCQLMETTAEFERLQGASASGEVEKEELRRQLQILAEKNRSKKGRMDELLKGVIHSQKGELERRKADFADLQDAMDSHADTIEKQKEIIRDLQSEKEAAATAACTAMEKTEEIQRALEHAEESSVQLQEEASSLRGAGELLRIERDRAISQVERLERKREEDQAARRRDAEETDTYRKAVKKMAKDRERLKTDVKEAEERVIQSTTALHEAKKRMEAARCAATSVEEASLSREAEIQERVRVAEAQTRQLDAKVKELNSALRQKIDSEEDWTRMRADAERQRDEARAIAAASGEQARQHGEERDSAKADLTAAAAATAMASESLKMETATANRFQALWVLTLEATVTAVQGTVATGAAELSVLQETVTSLERHTREAENRRGLLEARVNEAQVVLASERAARPAAEGRAKGSVLLNAQHTEELETLQTSLENALKDHAVAEDWSRFLATEKKVTMEELDKASGAIVSLKTAKGVLQEHLLVTKKEMRSSEGRSNRPNDGHEVAMSTRSPEKDKELQHLTDTLDTISEANCNLRHQSKVNLNACADLRERLVEADRKSVERAGAHAKEQADAISAHNLQLGELRAKVHQVDASNGDLQDTLKARVIEVQNLRDILELKTKEAKAVQEACMVQIKALQEEAAQSQANLQQERLRIEDVTAQAGRDREEADLRLRNAIILSRKEREDSEKAGASKAESEMERVVSVAASEALREKQNLLKLLEDVQAKAAASAATAASQLEDRELESATKLRELRHLTTAAAEDRENEHATTVRLKDDELVAARNVIDVMKEKERHAMEFQREAAEIAEERMQRALAETTATLAETTSAHQRETAHLRESFQLQQTEAAQHADADHAALTARLKEEGRLAEERILKASRERERNSAEACRKQGREDLEVVRREGQNRIEKLTRRLEGKDQEVEILNKQLRALGRQVQLLETKHTSREEELTIALKRGTETEADLSTAVTKWEDAARAAEGSKVVAQEALQVQRKEADERLALANQEALEAARAVAEEHTTAAAQFKVNIQALQEDKEEANSFTVKLEGKNTALESLVTSLRQDLEDALAERDEVESLGQKRGNDLGQRATKLGVELRAERATTVALLAAAETAKLDAEDREAEMAVLRETAAAQHAENSVLDAELPQLRACLHAKEMECDRLSDSRKEACNRFLEEASKANGLEREVGRLRAALRQSIIIVQEHISSADPHSPAALLAAEPALQPSVLQLGDATIDDGYVDGAVSKGEDHEDLDATNVLRRSSVESCSNEDQNNIAILPMMPIGLGRYRAGQSRKPGQGGSSLVPEEKKTLVTTVTKAPTTAILVRREREGIDQLANQILDA